MLQFHFLICNQLYYWATHLETPLKTIKKNRLKPAGNSRDETENGHAEETIVYRTKIANAMFIYNYYIVEINIFNIRDLETKEKYFYYLYVNLKEFPIEKHNVNKNNIHMHKTLNSII